MSRVVPVVSLLALAALACGGGKKDEAHPPPDAPAKPAEPTAAAWDGTHTFTCGGSEKKRIANVKFDVPGKDTLAIDAGGGCELEIIDSEITADFPLKAAGNAHVVVKGGKLVARQQAIQAWGNAVVDVVGATVVGAALTTGNGKINGVPQAH